MAEDRDPIPPVCLGDFYRELHSQPDPNRKLTGKTIIQPSPGQAAEIHEAAERLSAALRVQGLLSEPTLMEDPQQDFV